MNVLLPLLIVAIGPDPPIEARYPEAATVFHCTFDESWDENFDGRPDRWTRRTGPGFPHYVGIKISQESSPEDNRCLRIDLDGGAAVAYSPRIKTSPLFAYVLEGYLKTEGLKYDRAYFSVTLLNGRRHRLQTFYSDKVRQTEGWKKLRLGPIWPGSDVRFAVIGLHVQPESREDLKGAALFDDVWLGRLPRMALSTTAPANFFTDVEEVEIDCTASGFLAKDLQVTFQLEDVLGRELARLERRLATKPADTRVEASLDSFSDRPVGLIGKARWKPPIPEPGFYRVRATIKGRKALVLRQELTLAVVEPQRIPAGGEFGWTLPRGDKPLPLPLLSPLISQAGINWVKYPLWEENKKSPELIDRLIAFSERLSDQGIGLVGLLHDPPRSLRTGSGPSRPFGGTLEQSPSDGRPSAAKIFTDDPKVWYPSLEPIMTRLATRVRWWQLGDDKDASFVAYPNLAEKIAQVKTELDRIGQDVNLAVGWDWMSQLPQAADRKAPWQALTLSADPPMTHQELATYLDASKDANFQRWVTVEPVPKDLYPAEVRATDLVRRMIAAKIHGADAIFCPQPFSTDRGLMNDDGTPGELFFPWRTAALTLGGARYLGSIQLPRGSPNQIFARLSDAVMVVWNDKPTKEVIYLGEEVRQIDLWGRSITPAREEHRQVIRVGRLPTFVVGISGPITRWRMDFALARERIPSIFGQPHKNSFRLKNHFPGGAGGQATLVTPKAWTLDPNQTTFRLAGGEELEQPFEITLSYHAGSGRHPIRADFEIQAERSYRFSVYRQMDVGLGDIYIEVATQLNDQGELEVEQRFVNQGDGPVSFRCQLFVPGRRRLKTQIIGLGPGRDDKVYRLPNGKELLGKTLWLRAEEMAGPRILNYRVPVVAEQ